MTDNQKQEFLGTAIGGAILQAGIKAAVTKVLNRAAKSEDIPLRPADVRPIEQAVTAEVKKEVEARVEHATDTEPHFSSRNMWGVLFGLMGEAAIFYSFWTDNVPQDFQTDVAPHLMVVVGLLTPLYSRFVAKKPLGR